MIIQFWLLFLPTLSTHRTTATPLRVAISHRLPREYGDKGSYIAALEVLLDPADKNTPMTR